MKKKANQKKTGQAPITMTTSLFVANSLPSLDELKELIMDKQDVMQLLHISSGTLMKWRKESLLPYIKISGKIYYYKPMY